MTPLAATVALGLAATAQAQYDLPMLQATGLVQPARGGTPERPLDAVVKVAFTVNPESLATPDRIVYTLPADVLLALPRRRCTPARVNRRGERSCPPAARLGSGTVRALYGSDRTPVRLTVGLFAGDRSTVTVSVRGVVNLAFKATLAGRRLTVPIPSRVRRPGGGRWLYVTGVTVQAGAKLTGCPRDGTHDFAVALRLVPNPDPPALPSGAAADSTGCRRGRA